MRAPRSAAMRVMIRPTLVQAMRMSCVTADWEVWVASQATCSSNGVVNLASWRAQGTQATVTLCWGRLLVGHRPLETFDRA